MALDAATLELTARELKTVLVILFALKVIFSGIRHGMGWGGWMSSSCCATMPRSFRRSCVGM